VVYAPPVRVLPPPPWAGRPPAFFPAPVVYAPPRYWQPRVVIAPRPPHGWGPHWHGHHD
jgi:hypothetical protein